MEIGERDWLTVGFFWMAVGFIATMPLIGPSWLGVLARWIFNLTVAAHIGEAFYSTTLTDRAGLDRNQWFWRTLFLGYFSIRKLQSLPGGTAAPPS
jgi:transmembrane protein TMEM254